MPAPEMRTLRLPEEEEEEEEEAAVVVDMVRWRSLGSMIKKWKKEGLIHTYIYKKENRYARMQILRSERQQPYKIAAHKVSS